MSPFTRKRRTVASDPNQCLPGDVLILLLGVTGSGKSTFINDVLGYPKAKVSDSLLSPETTVTAYLASLPKQSMCQQHKNSRLMLVDTPGFDGDLRQDSDILAQIQSWISLKYGNAKKFSGIVYLHDISEKRIRHNTFLNLDRLKDLCGENPETKVVMATTHWDQVRPRDGESREKELQTVFWKDLLNGDNTNMMRLYFDPGNRQRDICRAIDFILDVTAPVIKDVPLKRVSEKWKKLVQSDDTFLEDGRPDDIIIAIMGSTGVGKSTFLNQAARLYLDEDAYARFIDPSPVGHGLESCTRNVVHHSLTLPMDHTLFPGRRVVLVDTPGFGDTHQDDSDILRRIGVWLANSYNHNAALGGVIFLSNIAQKRMLGSERLNLDVFQKMCGRDFVRMVVATTHWDVVKPDEGARREEELTMLYWRELIDQGAEVRRIQKKPHDIAAIIEGLLQALSVDAKAQVLQIQTELVDMEKIIPLTDAGAKLRHSLRILLDQHRIQLESGPTEEDRTKLQLQVSAALAQIEQLSVPLTDRVKNWFRIM